MVEKIISIRFEGDNTLPDAEKLTYTRYINRIFAGQKNDIITSNGHIKIISKKGHTTNVTFLSDDSELNKRIGLRLSTSELPY